MMLNELKNGKLKPLSDLIAFKWLKPKLKSGLLIPDNYYGLGLQLGKFYVGEVMAIGSKVRALKFKDRILIAEYGIKDFRGSWKEEQIYFIEEKFIKAKITGFLGLIERVAYGDER